MRPNQSNKTEGNQVISDLNQSKNITLIKNGSGLDKLASEPQLSNKSQKSPENKNSQQKLHDQDMSQIKLLSLTPQRDQNKGGLKKRQVNHTIEFLSGMTNMTLNQNIFEFQTPAAVNRRAARSILAKDYLQLTENETVLISKVMRYMCALCSKIFQKIFQIEETLLNMMLNPESSETAGDLIRKIEQDLFKTSTVPLLSQTGVPIPQDNCPYCDEPAYLLLNQFICITEGSAQQNVNNNETSVNLEQSPSIITQLVGKDQLRMITDQTQNIQNYQTLEVNLSGDYVHGVVPSNSAGQNNLSFVVKNQDRGAQVLTINNNALYSSQVKQTVQMPQHHILKQNLEKLFDCRQQKKFVHIYYLADQKCTSYHSRQKKMQNKSSFKFFSAGGGTGGFEGDDHLAQCEHQHMTPPQIYLPERVQCLQTNKLIMRNILDLKMKKNKSYYEVRNLNTNNNTTNFNPVDQLNYMRAANNQQNLQQATPNNAPYKEKQIPPIKESSSSIGEEGVQQNQPQVGIIGGTNMKLFPKEDAQMAAKVAQLKQQ